MVYFNSVALEKMIQTIKNFDKNHFQHLKVLRKKVEAVIPVTSSDNFPACCIYGHASVWLT